MFVDEPTCLVRVVAEIQAEDHEPLVGPVGVVQAPDAGSSAMHGPHQVAQKSRRAYCPLRSLSFTASPVKSRECEVGDHLAGAQARPHLDCDVAHVERALPGRFLGQPDADDLRADRADQAAALGRLVQGDGEVIVTRRDAADPEPAVRVQRDEVVVQGLEVSEPLDRPGPGGVPAASSAEAERSKLRRRLDAGLVPG